MYVRLSVLRTNDMERKRSFMLAMAQTAKQQSQP